MIDITSLSPLHLFMLLLGWHFIADFPLQGDYLAKEKDLTKKPNYIPWLYAMTAHCGIHAFGVVIITGSTFLGLYVFFTHFYIDYVKCKGIFTFLEDQYLHILVLVLTTVLYVVLT